MSFQAYLDKYPGQARQTPEDFKRLARNKGLVEHKDGMIRRFAAAKPPPGYDKKTMAKDVHALSVLLGFTRAVVGTISD